MQSTETAEDQQVVERSVMEQMALVGADAEFNEHKHGYVLAFPWNFDEIISNLEANYRPMSTSSYWHKFMVNSRAIVDLNNLFRDFHQSCAIPDEKGIERICEPKLAHYVNESIRRIHFHGLDIEMANLTVEQPSFRVMKAEIHQNLVVDRSQNRSAADYKKVSNLPVFGAKHYSYVLPEELDTRHFLDWFEVDAHRPYLVQLTCLIESPMKLYV